MFLESDLEGGGGGFLGVGGSLLEIGERRVGVWDAKEVCDEMEESLCFGE